MSAKKLLQHEAWASGLAADAFFERNKDHLNSFDSSSRSLKFYSQYIKSNDKILEIGCANGHMLEKLHRLTGCEAYGVDPSPKAIANGHENYPQINLAVGTADSLSFPDNFFTVVLFGFCLYLVDRNILMRVVAEADRVLTDNQGKLLITDFDPVIPHARSFKHQPNTWSYKMFYPNLWLSNPYYTLAEKISFSHEGDTFHPDPNERIASWILIKSDKILEL